MDDIRNTFPSRPLLNASCTLRESEQPQKFGQNKCFLAAELSHLLRPGLLALGLVTLDGREHYVELDLGTDTGKARVKASGDFVRGGVLDMWGLVPGAMGSDWEMGRRTGEWLLGLADKSGTRVEIAFDYSTDYELMEYASRDSGLWDRVREVVIPVNINAITGTIEGELAAEASYRETATRGLKRHHSLADALALRASYIQVKDMAPRLSHFVRTDDFRRLVAVISDMVDPADRPRGDVEGWVRRWLITEAFALNRRRPIDVSMEPGGIEQLQRLLGAICAGSYL